MVKTLVHQFGFPVSTPVVKSIDLLVETVVALDVGDNLTGSAVQGPGFE
jgi:hypothetical protein